MATAEWIESAVQYGRAAAKAPNGDGFVDRKAHHLLGGAYETVPGETSAARLLARSGADDIARAFALPAVQADAAAPLLALIAADDLTAARAYIGGLDPRGVSEVRLALKRRRENR